MSRSSILAALGALVCIFVAAGCGSGSAAGTGGPAASPSPVPVAREHCPQVGATKEAGVVADAGLSEISGMAASRKNLGVLWVHNDSGGDAVVYALSESGATLGEYRLAGVKARDWEDIAIGPGPESGADYLYVGDIGSNSAYLSEVTVLRVSEPTVDASQAAGEQTLDDIETIDVAYPDGPHNAETLLVDPETGDLFIVTKAESGDSGVYRAAAPLDTTATISLEEVARVRLDGIISYSVMVTGGDVSPDGSLVALRTYTSAYAWLRPPGTPIADAFAGRRCDLKLAPEAQGEALTFAADGESYFTVGEDVNPPIWQYPFES